MLILILNFNSHTYSQFEQFVGSHPHSLNMDPIELISACVRYFEFNRKIKIALSSSSSSSTRRTMFVASFLLEKVEWNGKKFRLFPVCSNYNGSHSRTVHEIISFNGQRSRGQYRFGIILKLREEKS